MKTESIIEAKGVGKKYRIAHSTEKYVALRDVLTTVLKNPFGFLFSKTKQSIKNDSSEDFWALKDVSFNIRRGEVVGIIGSNGAGKSTLLKILSQITPPTTGEITLRGRVSSLLEVGTGFHPELTGRENIYLNGAILGMTRSETAKKFDEIVTFAGVEQFLDTPVKYYSSGMYVRLAFSVAAHIDPDILIVDEVLAVGDAEFQKKCLGKMQDVTLKEGRTILFVSHNMAAIEGLCERTILLEKGQVSMFDRTDKVVGRYLSQLHENRDTTWRGEVGDEHIVIRGTKVRSLDSSGSFHTAVPIEITIEGEVLKPTRDLIIGFTLFSQFGYELAYSLSDDREDTLAPTVPPGVFSKRFVIPPNTLASGTYFIELDIGIHNVKRIVQNEGGLLFNLANTVGLGRRFPLPNIKGRSSLFRSDWSA